MSVADVVADQLRLPSGPLAPLVARALNRRNQHLIARTIAALDVQPHHGVLDIGFGGGVSLGLLSAMVPEGLVAGVDPSPEMVRRARRQFTRQIHRGRIAVEEGSVAELPFADRTFDRVLSSQTIYFWDCIDGGLREIRRVLAPGGRLAMAMMPKELQESLGFARRGYGVLSHEDLMGHLEASGFETIHRWPRAGADPRWVILADRA